MKIECLSTFLDGAQRFEAGDIRTVPDALAHKFVALGWAKEAGKPAAAEPAVGEVSLDIHNAASGLKDTNHG